MDKALAVAILAAGKGKRMKNDELPKVMVPLEGKPLVEYVLEQAGALNPEKIVLIVGHLKEKVIEHINKSQYKNAEFAVQESQLGTGHAVAQAEKSLADFEGDALILCGDVPLLSADTLRKFIRESKGAAASVLTTKAPDPTGYGRIIRNDAGEFVKIVEQKDANEDENLVDEINSGVFLVESGKLFESLKSVSNKNAQSEYYLTDIIEILRSSGEKVRAVCAAKFEELQGVNSPEDLEKARQYLIFGKQNA